MSARNFTYCRLLYPYVRKPTLVNAEKMQKNASFGTELFSYNHKVIDQVYFWKGKMTFEKSTISIFSCFNGTHVLFLLKQNFPLFIRNKSCIA